ncbi:uncharacterized protein [Venturia canescens]|uniref:uncharacterized protein n=1 Tax=Venturia canescens TaxID=32260 RepID=UPI001C9BF0B2|nr:uncharacterized protein LOC122408481 [Venturia canescens]
MSDAVGNNGDFEDTVGPDENNSLIKKINNRTEQPSRWYRFNVLTKYSAILRGSYAMNDMHFKQRSRGYQATSCSVVAIVFGRLFEPKDWTKDYVDQILEYGDKLFRRSITKNHVAPGVYLTTNLIYPEFYIDDYKCLICVEEGIVHGSLYSASTGCPDFAEGLGRFFKLNDSGVVTTQGTSVAVWNHPKAGYMYYDPSPCDKDGAKSKQGTACVIRFKNINKMTELFLKGLDHRYDSRYCIDKVNVLHVALIDRGAFESEDQLVVDKNILRTLNSEDVDDNNNLECTRPTPKQQKSSTITSGVIQKEPVKVTISNYKIDERLATEPLVDFKSLDTGYPYYDMEVNIPSTFKVLSDKMAILHGWTHESSDIYKGKGAQNVANCISAMAMKQVHPVKTWLRPKLDEILAQGDILYAQVKTDKPSMKTMTAADFDDTTIKIDNKRMLIDVDLLTIIGTISSKIPSVLSLKEALEEFFLVNKDGIIECSSMALAVWTQDDYYYIFDPRQCDATGTRIIVEKGKSAKTSKKGDSSVVDKKVKGKCCVIRFSDIDSLVAVFLNNVDPAKKNDRFTLRGIIVTDDLPGMRVWNEFQPGEIGKTWILRGGISNQDDRFEPASRGVQGIAMPIVALVNATETLPEKWTKDTVDQAVKDGDEYYRWSVPLEGEGNQILRVGDVKRTLYVKKRKVKIELQQSSIVGNLIASDDSKMPNLCRGLTRFFETHQYGIVEAKNLSVAVWKSEYEHKDKTKAIFYYLYDANPRDKLARRSSRTDEESVASVVRAIDLAELARLIETSIDPNDTNNDEFVIHDFKVTATSEPMTDEEIDIDKATPVKPNLNNYMEIDENSACLNGSFDQNNEIMFKHQTRDKQQAANGLVALAMKKLYDPHLWHREVVDDILKIGDRVAQQYSGNIPEPEEEQEEEGATARDYLLPIEIGETFDIGVNQITVNIDEALVMAEMSELTTNLENFFAENSMGIFRQDKTMLPIWKEGDVFFTMDPRGRDTTGSPKEKDGTATVLWFTGIPALASSLQLSVAKTDGNFIIDSVTLAHDFKSRVKENERPKKTTSSEDLWHNFPKKIEGIWELEGTIALDDERFDRSNWNKQTAAISIMAVIFSKAYEPRQWSSEVLDEVVITGDKFHTQCLKRLGYTFIPNINEMTREFFLSNRRIDLTMEDSVEAGYITGIPPKVQDIRTGLDKFFQRYNSGAVTFFNDLNIAIWKQNNFHFSVIPFETLTVGGVIQGRVRINRYADVNILGRHLQELMGPDGDYIITMIDVADSYQSPSWKSDPSPAIRPSNLPPLNAYHKLYGLEGEARAILRGETHQGAHIFPEKIRNRQTAANCVVAVAMSVVKDPVTWTKKTLDEILTIGTNLHCETEKTSPMKDRLKPTDIVRVFHLGLNVMTADVEESTVSGPVAVPPPEPEVKGKGKAKKKRTPKPKKAKKGKIKRIPAPPSPPIYLEEALPKFLEKNRAGVIVTGRYMAAIWKEHGIYFMFDPRSCGDHGLRDDNGTSCVMWFACLEPLYNLIFANIDDNEKYSHYHINRVIVRRNLLEPLPCPAGFRPVLECNIPSIPVTSTINTSILNVEVLTEYKIIDADVAVLRGSLHMSDRTFDIKSRGLQSTAIAAVAIVVAVLHVPSTWTSELVDAILKYGDLLHADTIKVVRPGARNLSPIELLTVFVVADFRANIHIHRHTAAGILHVYDLLQTLTLFFRNNCSGILHTPNIAVAVMQHYGKFYLFDPLARNDLGRQSHDGVACVVKCQSVERLAWHFVTNCNYKVPTVYTLNAVNVLNLHFYEDTRSKCPPFCDKQ